MNSSFRSGSLLSLWFLTEPSQDILREAVLTLQCNHSGPYLSQSETKPLLHASIVRVFPQYEAV